MVSKNMTGYSASLIIRYLQTKNAIQNHLISVRIAIIKNSTNNKCWRRCGEKGCSSPPLVGM